MGLKSKVVKILAPRIARQVYAAHSRAGEGQRKMLERLVRQSQHVSYLKDLEISISDNAQSISDKLPIVDYEDIRSYVNEGKARGKRCSLERAS